jgi:tetratricopeptide (TPR) repeat protein
MSATDRSASAAAHLALARQDRDDAEVIRYSGLAAAWTTADDVDVHAYRLIALAHVHAAGGELEAAEAAAREAVRLSLDSDDISQRDEALVDLGAVLKRAYRASEAATALRDAIASMSARATSSPPPARVRSRSSSNATRTSSTRHSRRNTSSLSHISTTA